MSSERVTAFELDPSPEKSRKWLFWLVFLLIALLLHLLVFLIHFQWAPEIHRPPPVEVNQVDPAKLDAIRNQWKKQSLLLNQSPQDKKDQVEAPPDARYFSDRNIRVEKEQRAKQTAPLPKPHRPGSQQKQKAKSSKNNAKGPAFSGNLSHLGIPFNLQANSKPIEQQSLPPEVPGGNQYVDEKNLPEGSENLLNAKESVYYSFYARIYEAFVPLWGREFHGVRPKKRIFAGDYSIAADVIFDDEGNFRELRILQGSGVPEFDDTVIHAWQKVPRFPNPPKGIIDNQRQIHMVWRFIIRSGDSLQFDSLPPES